jgi:hypothetical protein
VGCPFDSIPTPVAVFSVHTALRARAVATLHLTWYGQPMQEWFSDYLSDRFVQLNLAAVSLANS